MKNVLLKVAVLTVLLGALIALLIVLTKKKETIKEKGKQVVDKIRSKRAKSTSAEAADDIVIDETECCECECECDAAEAEAEVEVEAETECDACTCETEETAE